MIKLFDFNERSEPHSIIGYPREMAWPCKLFRVTLPKSKRNSRKSVNAFELCVLRLLAYGRYEPKDLANETCLPEDLIKVILLRLYDTGKIDKHYQLYPDVLKDIEKNEEERESEPSEYETWAIFQESVSGTVLPMLKEANLQSAETNEKGNLIIRVPKKGVRTRSLNRLDPVTKDADAPTTHDVLSAIRTMNRRCKMSEETYPIPSAEFVSVSSDSEQCKLRVRMVIQNNGDWRILNPFGKGWSLELESAYLTLLKNSEDEENNFKSWMDKNKGSNQQKKEECNRNKEPYDTDDNRDRYPELIRTLKRGEEIKNGIQKGADIYAALEWTLFYALKNCEATRSQIQLILLNSSEENEKSLRAAINYLVCKEDRIPLSLPYPKRFLGFQDFDKAEMQVVLPLAFLVAKDDSQFPFNTVLNIYPDFLLHYNAIKEIRNEYMHGNSRFSQPYGYENYVFMKDVISTLIPSIRFSESSPETVDADEIFDCRLNARSYLQEFFGVSLFNQMDSILQRELMNVEIFRNNEDKDSFDALPCINYLYSAAQCAFRPLLGSDHSKVSNPVSVAQQKAINAGWSELPQSLQKIRPDLLQHTMEGNDGSLGASVVVWLIRTDSAELSSIANKLPGFILDIDNLLSLRNHGNKSVVIHKEELNNCIDKIYKIIRTIMEA